MVGLKLSTVRFEKDALYFEKSPRCYTLDLNESFPDIRSEPSKNSRSEKLAFIRINQLSENFRSNPRYTGRRLDQCYNLIRTMSNLARQMTALVRKSFVQDSWKVLHLKTNFVRISPYNVDEYLSICLPSNNSDSSFQTEVYSIT